MQVHLVDGTYELFRNFFGAPPARAKTGQEVGATRGLLRTLVSLLNERTTTHVACAFDHEIESFRNRLFDGYKRGEGIEPSLLAQFELAERAASALGLTVWPMEEFEADDALATGAARYGGAEGVERVLLCSPDKDLAQCVIGRQVVMLDRRKRQLLDEQGVWDKFGVAPASIPDYLALVGDAADGIPGIPRWGAKSAAAVLACYGRVDRIPADHAAWQVKVRGAKSLSASLEQQREDAALYRTLAVLRTDVPEVSADLDAIRWRGARRVELEALCDELDEHSVLGRITLWHP